MNRKDILLVYKQGSNSIMNLVETLCDRIQELEFTAKNSKNSDKVVIIRILSFGWCLVAIALIKMDYFSFFK